MIAGILLFLIAMPLPEGFSIIFDENVHRFPYITYQEVWKGTPARVDDAAVPLAVIAYGEEPSSVIAAASQISYYLGQWTEDMGINPEIVRKGKLPQITIPLKEALKMERPVVLIGINNEVVKGLRITFYKPTLKVVKWQNKKVLIIGGKDTNQVLTAAYFLAHKVIAFKAGAYKTFFSFVKLRGLIEKENFKAAEYIIKDPSGLSACGKNMSLVAPMMSRFSPEVKRIIKKRNQIMYVELSKALQNQDKERAIFLWKEAMKTCYQCHQGQGIPRLRKFIPNPRIHAKHQRIARKFGLIRCAACHSGSTRQKGYKYY